MSALTVDGRFFSLHERKITLRGVTLGPLPPEYDLIAELPTIASLGANMVRVYQLPTREFLDQAHELELQVFASSPWPWDSDFLNSSEIIQQALQETKSFLSQLAHHPALAGLYIANEIPVDLIRWMGITKVKEALEGFIDSLRAAFPDILYAYANFPTTEFLELRNADFTAFNLYLEDEENFRHYLQHLQVLSGSRPVVISEFGVDAGTLSTHGEEGQAEILSMAARLGDQEGIAGLTYFAWSDLWWKGERLVPDWEFGLQRADGTLRQVAHSLFQTKPVEISSEKVSVIVCTYNGALRIPANLEALLELAGANYEVLIVNDGSNDESEKVALSFYEKFQSAKISYKVITQKNHGLSHARNTGAQHASGTILAYTDDDARPHSQWLNELRKGFESPEVGMCGGYGIPPLQSNPITQEVARLPGQASPVLLSSTIAEHLPGCNMAVRKSVWQEIDGFREHYRVAGDDVDFCWRVIAAGYLLRFTPNAYVWHEPRSSYYEYLKQQWGYGKAEALLARDYPERVQGSGVSWKGLVYSGESIGYTDGCTIYGGLAGIASFQPLQHRTETGQVAKTKRGRFLARYYPLVRMLARWRHGVPPSIKAFQYVFKSPNNAAPRVPVMHTARYWREEHASRTELLTRFQEQGWQLVKEQQWDAEKGGLVLQIALEHPDSDGITLLLRSNGLAEAEDVLNEWTKL